MKILDDPTLDKKGIEIDSLLRALPQLSNVDFWRELNPTALISDFTFTGREGETAQPEKTIDSYLEQLQEERYFQTPTLIPLQLTAQMRECIEAVQRAGFPAIFALVYDVFYEGMTYHHDVMAAVLGKDYKIVPDFWVYNISPSDESKGFQPHRDTEYVDTIDENGLPVIVTAWLAITDATPLNSCMYILPANRDANYKRAIHTLDKVPIELFPLENLRALPASAGSLTCWDQYVLHWGSRSSKRAEEPRMSCAFYYQRGDIPPVSETWIDLTQTLTFSQRLALICRGLHKYSRLNLESLPHAQPLQRFLAQQSVMFANT